MKKFAILSHVLPPSPSGQGIIIYRLLKDLDPEQYYLISNKDYTSFEDGLVASDRLAAPYFSLSQERVNYRITRPEENSGRKSPLQLLAKFPWLYRVLRQVYLQRQHIPLLRQLLLETRQRSQRIYELLQAHPVETLIACTGDIANLPAAYLACRRAKIRFVPYIFDDYVYQWTGFTRFVLSLFAKRLFQDADQIIVTNEVMQDEFKRRYQVETTVIRNLCPIPEPVSSAPPIFESGKINIVYAGATYVHQNALANLAAAIRQLADERIVFHLYTSTDAEKLKASGIDGKFVSIHPHIPQEQVFEVLRQADVLFLPLAFDSHVPHIVKTASPGKMGEYLALARPIVVHAPAGSFITEFFRKNDCGIVVDKNDSRLLAQALSNLLADEGLQTRISQRARQLAIHEFAIDVVVQHFEALLSRLHFDGITD